MQGNLMFSILNLIEPVKEGDIVCYKNLPLEDTRDVYQIILIGMSDYILRHMGEYVKGVRVSDIACGTEIIPKKYQLRKYPWNVE